MRKPRHKGVDGVPIKGLILIVLLVVVIALINREQIYSWLQNEKRDDDNSEYTEDEEE